MALLLKEKISDSIKFLLPRISQSPKVAIVLGSGLGKFAESLASPAVIPTAEIPHYPASTVPGHQGRWVIGTIENVPVLAIQGRVHFYEGYSLEQVTYPIHLLASLGVSTLILTTACGGLNPEFSPGDLMLIRDHINFAFGNPLIGKPDNQLGPRFPDMSQPYDPHLMSLAEQAAKELKIPLRKGVFCWVTGPAYETAAEVRMLRKFGGDAVSMSTVPEVIVAQQRHLQVLGIALITNLATGIARSKLTHREVTEMANKAGERMGLLLKALLIKLDGAIPPFQPERI
jgi:purine-nucleoside phosphorylase